MNKLLISGVALLTAAFVLPAFAQEEAPDKKKKGPRGDRGERGGRPERMFEKTDVDNNGTISLKEMQDHALARSKEHFERLDADKNGEVTKDEFKAGRPMGPRGGKGHKGGPKPDDAPEDAAEDAPDA